ncbi:hypothetical protein CUR86_08130 [Salinicola acroporae]|uniref:Helix-turn-helix domain-containing protein n=1 Tax=Salinicola acroporae TaxID=1541440 RepID=A0ABT6I4H9_9GAMM|nr:hypothetical protein [Salinicola acroporae]
MMERYSDNPIIRVGEAAKSLGISRKTLYNWWAKYGRFPPPTEYSPGVRGWRKATFEESVKRMEQTH